MKNLIEGITSIFQIFWLQGKFRSHSLVLSQKSSPYFTENGIILKLLNFSFTFHISISFLIFKAILKIFFTPSLLRSQATSIRKEISYF